MTRETYRNYKRGVSTLEYAMLIVITVGAMLGAQNYFKRSMQGQYQIAADQLANQYAFGLTEGHEHFTSEVRTTEWKLPGPCDIIKIRGSFETSADHAILPLTTTLYHKKGWANDSEEE